jgi:hypothetical protein
MYTDAIPSRGHFTLPDIAPPLRHPHTSTCCLSLSCRTQVIRVYRTKTAMLYDTGAKVFVKATFPVQLAYSMTGHKCQGATLSG